MAVAAWPRPWAAACCAPNQHRSAQAPAAKPPLALAPCARCGQLADRNPVTPASCLPVISPPVCGSQHHCPANIASMPQLERKMGIPASGMIQSGVGRILINFIEKYHFIHGFNFIYFIGGLCVHPLSHRLPMHQTPAAPLHPQIAPVKSIPARPFPGTVPRLHALLPPHNALLASVQHPALTLTHTFQATFTRQ